MNFLRRSGGGASSKTVDLSTEVAATATLLRNPLEWRIRAVEHVGFDTASTCARRRTLQCAPLRPVLGGLVPAEADRAFIALHLASVPRGALLDLDLEGPDGSSAHLLKREEIALREEAFIYDLIREIGQTLDWRTRELVVAMLSYTKTAHEHVTGKSPLGDLAEYLKDGYGTPVPQEVLRRLRELDSRAAKVVELFDDSGASEDSPTAHPIVALPLLGFDDAREGLDAGERALAEYVKFLEHVQSTAHEGSAEWELLGSIADYGHNYDLMVATEVPLDRPFLLKYSERRDIAVQSRGWIEQDVVTSDAGSNHVVLYTTDPAVEIKNAEAVSLDKRIPAFGAFTTRSSSQTFAVYAHDRDREYRMRFRAQLRTSLRIRGTVYAAAVLLLALAAAVWLQPPTTVSNFALIVGPTSLAASVLLFREPSTLGSRLRRASTTVLTFGLIVLLTVSIVSYVRTTVLGIDSTNSVQPSGHPTSSTSQPTPRG